MCYYNPDTGRFLQQDPDTEKLIIPITVYNKCIYTGNNPINRTDPSGKFFIAALFALGSLLAGGATVTGALTAIGATLLGSMAIGAVRSILIGDWSNFWGTTESVFNISAGFLGASTWASKLWGGGIVKAGANGIFQGYVSSNTATTLPNWIPIIGGKAYAGGLTFGTSGLFSGANLTSISAHAGVTLAYMSLDIPYSMLA